MHRTQIQLPDDLYRRAKAYGEEKEMPLAEIVRRALERLLDCYPGTIPAAEWKLPTFSGGATLVHVEDLKRHAGDDETLRSLPHSS